MARCAIYTRKSTDEGLDQEFNSLDAQREACEAYIRSQKHEGWKALPPHYDDGGYSGGSMDRPALKQLLLEIEAKRVDIVVVYKVDRLTRSLPDFVRMVEQFDRNGVSFVSVTQQFNTTSSMGRLTLNMLLSFAQFEREVTAERIRDKVAASKKKGMWMGGNPPLGYDVCDRKLVINPAEAKTVQNIFKLYSKLGTVRRVKEELDQQRIRTKQRQWKGAPVGGKPFSRGNLYELLANPIYIGEVRHNKKTYPGQHEGIVDLQTWTAVQSNLDTNARQRTTELNGSQPHLLTGLLFDEAGEKLSPTHTNKKGRRYYYYISKRLMHDGANAQNGWRLPAKELEAIVIQSFSDFLTDQNRLLPALKLRNLSATATESLMLETEALVGRLHSDNDDRTEGLFQSLIRRVTLSASNLSIRLSTTKVLEELGRALPGAPETETVDVETPIQIARRGVETKLIICSKTPDLRSPDQNLIELTARAQCWLSELSLGEVMSIQELAKREKMNERDTSRILRLAFIAPEIVEAIFDGHHPVDLTMKKMQRACFTNYEWRAQQACLGFSRLS